MNYSIYMHTSKTSRKSYIGLTKRSIKKRFSEHISLAFRGSGFYFHKAIKLYGAEDFYLTVLHKNIKTIAEANHLEAAYIIKHDTFENGYNLTLGGDGVNGSSGWTKSSESKRKQSESMKKIQPNRIFIHEKYGIEILTTRELVQKYNLNRGNLGSVISGKIKQTKGWKYIGFE